MSDLRERLRQRLTTSLDETQRISHCGTSKSRNEEHLNKSDPTNPTPGREQESLIPESLTNDGLKPNTGRESSHRSNQLVSRSQKQEHIHNSQLSRVRAEDRRSLMHLPTSQQRSILLNHHKQLDLARRSTKTQQSRLETAGNHLNRLSTIRLIRKPPHTGNMFSLNH